MTNRLKKVGMRLKEVTSNKDFMRKMGKAVVTVAYVMFVIAAASEFVIAAEDKDNILTSVESLLGSIEDAILKWSAVAVVIGVGVGAIMKKFSMGKQDKIEMGNKLMKDSIIAFVILNATPKIVNFITGELGHGNDTINTK